MRHRIKSTINIPHLLGQVAIGLLLYYLLFSVYRAEHFGYGLKNETTVAALVVSIALILPLAFLKHESEVADFLRPLTYSSTILSVLWVMVIYTNTFWHYGYPLGVSIVALCIRAACDKEMYWPERRDLLHMAILNLVISGEVAFLIVKLLN